MLAEASADSCGGSHNEIGHPVRCQRRSMPVSVQSARGLYRGSKTCVIVHYNCQRYICGLGTALVSLGGLKIVFLLFFLK